MSSLFVKVRALAGKDWGRESWKEALGEIPKEERGCYSHVADAGGCRARQRVRSTQPCLSCF